MGGHKAFVGLPRRVAEHLLRERATLEVRGHTHPLRLSLQSQEQSAGIDAPSNSDNRGHRSSRREDGDTFRRQPSKRRSSKKHHKKGKKNKNKGKRKHHRNNDKK